MKVQILDDIRRLAAENEGRPPSIRQFEDATGVRESVWRGVLWANWSEAVTEAGLTPNPLPHERRIEDDVLLEKLAEACRYYGKVPTVAQLRMRRRADPDFPYVKTFERRFGGFADLGAHIQQWVVRHDAYRDVADMLGAPKDDWIAAKPAEGSVYLLRSGDFYKIGRSDALERRVKEIRVALPEAATLVHAIRTDDSSGIEAYWHRRFAERRANGEWFKLDRFDVAAFKRRRFQ